MDKIKNFIKVQYNITIFFIQTITLIILTLLVYNSFSSHLKQKTFYLSSSDSDTLLKTLEKYGYTTYPIDHLFLKFVTPPKKGWYHISNEEGRVSFFKDLYKKRAKTMEVEVFAGETSKELTKRLANDMKLSHLKLLRAYWAQTTFQEGDIIAGRYVLAREADANTTISYLLNTSNKFIKKFIKENYSKEPSKLELKILLIIASIIQKESNRVDEMPLISSVIYNRLNKNMRLQMDGTLNYGDYAHIIVTPERIKTDTSYFNTYKYKGIPPVPLSTVSIEALKAAFAPKQSDYFYFMLTKDGSHIFADDYKTHLANVRTFKKYKEEQNLTIAENNSTQIYAQNTTNTILSEDNSTKKLEQNATEITKKLHTIITIKEEPLSKTLKPKKLHKIQN